MSGKKMAMFLLAVCALLLPACENQETQAGLRLWFPTNADSRSHSAQAVYWEEFVEGAAAESEVEALVDALLAGPGSDGLVDPFPENTRLLGWELSGGLLSLDFSEDYGTLTGVNRTLADYCIVLTMCQLEQVDQVCLRVEGILPEDPSRLVLSPDDIIFTGAEEEPRQIDVALYYPRALGKGLGFETRELTLTEDDDLYVMIAGELLRGPLDPDLHTFLPEEDTLLGVWMDDGVCYVNFSDNFLSQAPEETTEQNLLLYSVVDTLGNLDSVMAVQLLVEGERLPEFGGVETNLPLEPDFGLLSGG